MIGNDLGLTATQSLEQIAIGHGTQTLVPRIVAWAEVGHIHVITQLTLSRRQQGSAHQLWALFGQFVHKPLKPDVAGTGQAVNHHLRHKATHAHRDRVHFRHRGNIGRRTLQHGNVGAFFGHGRHQGDGSSAGTDHHHFLAFVIQVFRPVLRMNHLALEVFLTGEIRFIAFVIVVITATGEQEVGGKGFLLAGLLVGGFHRPVIVSAGPVRLDHLATKTDMFFNVVLFRGLFHVLANRVAIGQYLGLGPGAKAVAQSKHVGIRTNARVLEQIPGAADAFATLQDSVGAIRRLAG